jgi:chromosome segregation ATPase
MPSEFDPSEFVDQDFESGRRTPGVAPAATTLSSETTRAPSREELEARVGTMQNKLSELKRAQQELEREPSELEETRRRQAEFTKGRQEMEQHLTRGIALLEEAEFTARRDAEQMSKSLVDLREALLKVQAVHEETWTRDNLNIELTRALTTIENARMEWNSARLKFTVLNGETPMETAQSAASPISMEAFLQQKSYAELCKLGLAITWPIALVGLGILVFLFLRH